MIPPECDTVHGGFYINCGSLEFKNVANNQSTSDGEQPGGSRRNKVRSRELEGVKQPLKTESSLDAHPVFSS